MFTQKIKSQLLNHNGFAYVSLHGKHEKKCVISTSTADNDENKGKCSFVAFFENEFSTFFIDISEIKKIISLF